jgi:hypothetical protein
LQQFHRPFILVSVLKLFGMRKLRLSNISSFGSFLTNKGLKPQQFQIQNVVQDTKISKCLLARVSP